MKIYNIKITSSQGEEIITQLNEIDTKRTEMFFKNYECKVRISGSERLIIKSHKKIKRCRFCNKEEGETTFVTTSHVIPQLFNRAKPTSEIECDACNKLFCQFESDLSNFFLIERSLFGIKRKKSKLPKYKSNTGIEIESLVDNNNEALKARLKNLSSNGPNIDEVKTILFNNPEQYTISDDRKKISFSISKPPYRPINVFKMFLKMALSLMHETDLDSHKNILNLLFNKELKINEKGMENEIMANVMVTNSMRPVFKEVLVSLYQRSSSNEELFRSVLIFCFGNQIIQVPIPDDNNIESIYSEKKEVILIKASPFNIPISPVELFKDESLKKTLESMHEKVMYLCNDELERNDSMEFTIHSGPNYTFNIVG